MLVLAFVGPAKAQVPPGFFDVSTVAGVDPTGGSDSTAGLNRAIEMARDADAVAYFPPGDYRISDTLVGAMGARLTSGGSSFCAQFDREIVLMGAYVGARQPRLLLDDRAAGFGNASAPKPVVHVLLPDIRPGMSGEGASCAFRSGILNFEVVLGDNPGAVGVEFDGAQESFIQDVRVDARGGLAGFSHAPGRSSVNINLEVVGGRNGLLLTSGSLGAQFVGLTLRDQTGPAIVTGVWRGISVTGFEISGPGPAVQALSGNIQSGNIVLIDGSADLTGGGPLVETSSRFAGLRNVHVRGASAILTGGPALPTGGWTRVDVHANAPPAGSFSGNGTAGAVTLLDGVTGSGPVVETTAGAAPPPDLVSRHLFALPAWDRPGTRDVRDYGATPDDGRDDTTALQAAIDAGGDVFIPAGRYIVSAPLLLGASVRLFGAFRRNSLIDADPSWRPASETWMVETVDDPSATTYLGDLLLDHPRDATLLLSGVRWRSGRRTVVVRVHYESRANRAETLPRHAYRIEGNGGGRWYGWNDFQRHESALGPPNADFRKLVIEGTSEPITFYGYNPEHTKSDAAIEIIDAVDVRFIGAKNEASRTDFILRNVRSFFGAMLVDNPSASNRDVIRVIGGGDIELLGILAPAEGGPGAIVVESSLPGAGSVGRDRYLSLYRRGSLDWSAWDLPGGGCGDGTCGVGESCGSCAPDCGACPDAGVVDAGPLDASDGDASVFDGGRPPDGAARTDAGAGPPSGGCACRAVPSSTAPREMWLALLGLALLGRGRRRSSSEGVGRDRLDGSPGPRNQ